MAFISYAQNFEDVMLWRALKHVERGFYVDVGANDPIADSVTKAFYDRGWNGINIEPVASHYSDLERERTRDINLPCAAGDHVGEIEIWECDVRGWATVSGDVIEQHQREGHRGNKQVVPVSTLANICEAHIKGEVHFLKIDVEGFERSVIAGMDFSRFRPWVMVIEATKPNTTDEVYDEWEHIVLSAGYALAYADGLNRFYVANEHPELLPAFQYPPNIFDGFKLAGQHQAEARATEAQTRAAEADIRAAEAQAQVTEAQARATEAQARATEAQAQVTEAQARAAEANIRATDAQARTTEAQTQVAEAQARAAEADIRATEAQARVAEADIRTTEAQARAHTLQADLDAVHAANHKHWQLAESHERHIQAIYQSYSWRITTPLRWLGTALHHFAPRVLKLAITKPLNQLAKFVMTWPKLNRAILAILNRFPALKWRLWRMIFNNIASQQAPQVSSDLSQLTPRARQIYADLKAAIEMRQKERD